MDKYESNCITSEGLQQIAFISGSLTLLHKGMHAEKVWEFYEWLVLSAINANVCMVTLTTTVSILT